MWTDYLHFSFHDKHVLLYPIKLDSYWSFFFGSILIASICFVERFITFALDKRWKPITHPRRSRWKNVLSRSIMFWIASMLRLFYMLVAMTFHLGLIMVVATCLSIAYLVTELSESEPLPSNDAYQSLAQSEPVEPVPLTSISTRPRSRSKPDEIHIHPAQSNVARADALAHQLGLTSPNKTNADFFPKEDAAWELGKGPEMARALLGNSRSPSSRPFTVGKYDSDSD